MNWHSSYTNVILFTEMVQKECCVVQGSNCCNPFFFPLKGTRGHSGEKSDFHVWWGKEKKWTWKIFMCPKARTFFKINGSGQENIETSLRNVPIGQSWHNLTIKKRTVAVVIFIKYKNHKSIKISRKRKN